MCQVSKQSDEIIRRSQGEGDRPPCNFPSLVFKNTLKYMVKVGLKYPWLSPES